MNNAKIDILYNTQKKSVGGAFLLALLFGPFGMLYGGIVAGIVALLVSLIIASAIPVTSYLMWFVWVVVVPMYISGTNDKLREQLYAIDADTPVSDLDIRQITTPEPATADDLVISPAKFIITVLAFVIIAMLLIIELPKYMANRDAEQRNTPPVVETVEDIIPEVVETIVVKPEAPAPTIILPTDIASTTGWTVTENTNSGGERFNTILNNIDGNTFGIACFYNKSSINIGIVDTTTVVGNAPKLYAIVVDGHAEQGFVLYDTTPVDARNIIKQFKAGRNAQVSVYNTPADFKAGQSSDTFNINLIGFTLAISQAPC